MAATSHVSFSAVVVWGTIVRMPTKQASIVKICFLSHSFVKSGIFSILVGGFRMHIASHVLELISLTYQSWYSIFLS
jgi:hypothetical protein